MIVLFNCCGKKAIMSIILSLGQQMFRNEIKFMLNISSNDNFILQISFLFCHGESCTILFSLSLDLAISAKHYLNFAKKER